MGFFYSVVRLKTMSRVTTKYIGIALLIFFAIYAIALRVVNNRESICAERCVLLGYMAHDYKGFSAGGRGSLKPDVCTCKNVNGETKVLVGLGLWR